MILLMGIAGSGKGTQGKMLADQNKMHLISMGDIIRMYITGNQRDKMLAGALIDDQEIIKLVGSVLDSIPDEDEVILDGFPRTIPQAKWLLNQAKTKKFTLHTAIHLVASRQAVKQRLIKRARIDDTEQSIESRFDEYERSTHPLIDWLRQNDINVVDIDAEQPVEVVNKIISKTLNLA